jgi:pantoate--beta-alanine ligase
MVADLLLPLTIVAVETVREADGVALSSRNRFLSEAERLVAPVLQRTLRAVAARIGAGEAVSDVLLEARTGLAAAGFAVDYVALVEGATLVPLPRNAPGARLIAAARLGPVRLLDNIGLD